MKRVLLNVTLEDTYETIFLSISHFMFNFSVFARDISKELFEFWKIDYAIESNPIVAETNH